MMYKTEPVELCVVYLGSSHYIQNYLLTYTHLRGSEWMWEDACIITGAAT